MTKLRTIDIEIIIEGLILVDHEFSFISKGKVIIRSRILVCSRTRDNKYRSMHLLDPIYIIVHKYLKHFIESSSIFELIYYFNSFNASTIRLIFV